MVTIAELRALLASRRSRKADHSPACSCQDCEHAQYALEQAAVNALPALLDALGECVVIARERTTAWSGATEKERAEGCFAAREDEAKYILRAIEETVRASLGSK